MHGNTENLIYVQKLRDPSQFGVASILNLQTGQISTFAEKDLEVVITSAFNALPAVFVDAMSEVPDNFQNAYLTLIRSARGTRLPKFHQVARKLNENYAENKDLDAATKALLLQIIDRKGIAFEELFHFNRDIVLRLTDLTLGLIRTAQIPAKFGDLFVERVKMQAQNPNYFKRLKFEKITQEEALALDRVIRCSSGELKPSEEIARIAARFENAYLVNESVELAVLFRKCLFALDEMGYAGIFEELLPGEKELYLEGDHCDFDFNEIDSDLTGINIEALIQDFFRQISLGPVPELEDIQ